MQTAKEGIWTPWAKIMCFECHGPKFPRSTYDTSSPEWAMSTDANKPLEENYAITKCDVCGCDIQLPNSIAEEHNIVLNLMARGVDASMSQTGGMCSAAQVNCTNGYLLIGYDHEGDNLYYISRFNDEDEWLEGDDPMLTTQQEVIDFVLKAEGVKRV